MDVGLERQRAVGPARTGLPMNPMAAPPVPRLMEMRIPGAGVTRPTVPRALAVAVAGLLLALVGCAGLAPSASPTPSAFRPAISIDESWTAIGGQWTFTGTVDPEGEPTDVVLEVGSSFQSFQGEVPVAEGLTTAGPLEITTDQIPDIDDICVRFKATNAAGTSVSTPLCFPHDLPSFAPTAPTVAMDETWTLEAGEWTFTGQIDPGGMATDVVLEIGVGPAASAQFASEIPVAQDLTDQARLDLTTADIPAGLDVCVRFSATNELGTASSTPVCFPNDG